MLAILLWSVFTAGIVVNVFMPALWVLGGVSFMPSELFLKALFKRDQYEQKISDFFQNATDLNQIERLNRFIFDGLDPNIKNRDGITALIRAELLIYKIRNRSMHISDENLEFGH